MPKGMPFLTYLCLKIYKGAFQGVFSTTVWLGRKCLAYGTPAVEHPRSGGATNTISLVLSDVCCLPGNLKPVFKIFSCLFVVVFPFLKIIFITYFFPVLISWDEGELIQINPVYPNKIDKSAFG